MKFDSTKHELTWFRDRYLDGTLTIKPPYQRKPVWRARQKCFLVESVLLDMPIPEIYLQKNTTADGKTEFAVVDGQQRMRTLLQFMGAETDPEEVEYNNFTLDKLPQTSKWYNLKFDEFKQDDKIRYWNYVFSVRYLETADDEVVRDMFVRLNKYLAPLKPQELRNALWQGPFVKLAVKLADQELPGSVTTYWAENGIVTAAAIRRMADVEFISELVIGVMHGPQGGSSKVIDSYYERFEDYDDTFPEQQPTEKRFQKALDAIQLLFPNIRSVPRWANKTDFYTLFVAVAGLLRENSFLSSKASHVRASLVTFASAVQKRLADEHAKASAAAIKYVRAVEKGANEKHRRSERHEVVTELLQEAFAPRTVKNK